MLEPFHKVFIKFKSEHMRYEALVWYICKYLLLDIPLWGAHRPYSLSFQDHYYNLFLFLYIDCHQNLEILPWQNFS